MSRIISSANIADRDLKNIMIRCLKINKEYGNKFMPLCRRDTKDSYYFVLGSLRNKKYVKLLGAPRPYCEKGGIPSDSNKLSMGIVIEDKKECEFVNKLDNILQEEVKSKELCSECVWENTLHETEGYLPMIYVKFIEGESKVYKVCVKKEEILSREIKNDDSAMIVLKLDRVTVHKNRLKLDCIVREIHVVSLDDNIENL